ncbi:MAG: histidine--tRNA ligase [Gemmatimonadota bacterium]
MTKGSSKSTTFRRLPGFRDFVPEDFALRAHIFEAWRRVARRSGFLEYDAPPLEPLELYTEKSGAEIVGQLYNFQDKGGRDISLRPEMTPSLARILGERSRSMPKPIRWFSIPQLFRYERQQRGRLREHFQWNVDLVGEESTAADAEVLAVAINGLRELGLDHTSFRARVSDRRLLSALLSASGVEEDRLPDAYAVIDKVEREGEAKTRERLEGVGMEPDAAGLLFALFAEPGLESVRRHFGDREEVAGILAELETYLSDLEAMGLGEYVGFDLSIVRGLAYYTGIVFELFDREGELRAICGGGRYDRLVEWAGGESLPAVGFGMGDVVLGELLSDRGLVPEYRRALDYFIVTIGDDLRPLALGIARRLREDGHSVVYPLRAQSVRKQFASAATEGAGRTIVLGPDEVARGVAIVRDMGTGEEQEVSLDELR